MRHELASVHLLRLVLVMRAAPQDDSLRIVQVRAGEPIQVIELEEARLLAPVPAPIDKRAASAVAAIDVAPDRRRYLPRRRRARKFGCFGARFANGSKALLLDFLDQRVESLVEDPGDVPRWDAVPQEVLRPPELVAQRPAGRELHRESVLAERCDDGALLATRSQWRGNR